MSITFYLRRTRLPGNPADDYEVFDSSHRPIGRIMRHPQTPEDRPWFWTITAREIPPSVHNRGYSDANRRWLILRRNGAQAVILKSENYNFHRLDLTRQAGFIVTVFDEDGLKLATTNPCPTPAEAFVEARKIVDNKIEGPRKK